MNLFLQEVSVNRIRIFERWSFPTGSSLTGLHRRMILALICAASGLFLSLAANAQTNGDFRSTATGNWNDVTIWQRYQGGAWRNPGQTGNNPGQYPGQNTGTQTVTIRNGHEVTINVSPANAIINLSVENGGILIFGNNNTARTLNVSGNIEIDAGGTFRSRTAGSTVNTLNAGGNFTNDGTVDFTASSFVNTVFTNTAGTKTISGTGTTFVFNNITLEAGNVATTLVSTASISANAVTIGAPSDANENKLLQVNGGTLTCSSLTLSTTTNDNRDTNVEVNAGARLTVNGNITTDTNLRSAITLNGTGWLDIQGTYTTGTFTPSATSTVRWFGDNTNFRTLTYGNLIIEIPASATANRIKSPGAAMIVQGDFTAQSLHASNTVSLDPAGNDFTVNGATTINARAGVIDSDNAGTNTFSDDVTIAANGALTTTNNSAYNFSGNIINDGTLSIAGTGTKTLATAGTKSITGSGSFTFSNLTLASGKVVSVNTTSDVSVTGAITFAANSANSSLSVDSNINLTANTITFSDPAANSLSQTLTVNAGTVITSGDVTLANTSSNSRTNNVVVNSSGTLTVNGSITTNGAADENYLTLNGTGILNIAGSFTGGTFTVSNTGAPSTMSTVRWFGDNTNFRNLTYGNLIIEIPAGATGSRIKSPGGAMIVQGNFTAQSLHATNTVSLDPAGNDLTVNGSTYLNARGKISDGTTAGTNTFAGVVNIAANGVLERTANNPAFVFQSNISNDGSVALSGGTTTASFTGAGNKTISGAGTFSTQNLTLNTSGAANVIYNGSSNLAINGTLTFSANGLLVVGGYANVVLGSAATISGNNASRYIQLDGNSGTNSQLIKTSTNNVTSLRMVFPVGTPTGGYTPLDLNATAAVTGSNPPANSTLAVKPVYGASATGLLRRSFRLTVSGNTNATTLTNARFYYNAATDVSGSDNISTYNTIWLLNSNTGAWTNPTGTAPGSGYFTAPGTAQTLSNGTYYYTIGTSSPQCPLGDQNEYGVNSWIGHVYDGANNFQSANYLGRFTEPQNFDENFGGDYNNFALSGPGCTVYTETYSVRFRMALNVTTCGVYPITIGGDDGVRLSVDGGATWETQSLYNDHSYSEVTENIYLDAGINYLVLEFYENATNNRVRFSMAAMNGTLVTGGKIGGAQTLCQSSIDPALLTSVTAARNCSGDTPAYQWQYSSTNNFSSDINDIPSANSATYDPPTQPIGTRYYRRRAVLNSETVYSNIIAVVADMVQGDQVTPGNNSWIGYVYDGANNFSTNYIGYLTAAQTFDYSFCGDNCTEPITGCDFTTETFTIRYRMNYTPATSQGYTFTIGADDGVRLSLDGGSTFILNDWSDHGYREISSSVINLLAGNTYNMVLEYYENGGGNRVRFNFTTGPLPVTWSFLDGYYNQGKNIIDWRTVSEKNNAGFVVERSFDGVQFDSLGFVPGNGTTLLAQSYTFADMWPGAGWNYYRLKQIDYDKAFEYSKVIPVFADDNLEPGIYPNPASSSLYISHGAGNAVSDAHLLNAQTGQVIPLTRDDKQPSRYPLDRVPTGTYIVSFTIDGKPYTKKVVVVR